MLECIANNFADYYNINSLMMEPRIKEEVFLIREKLLKVFSSPEYAEYGIPESVEKLTK